MKNHLEKKIFKVLLTNENTLQPPVSKITLKTLEERIKTSLQ